jgi:hypothetical protein
VTGKTIKRAISISMRAQSTIEGEEKSTSHERKRRPAAEVPSAAYDQRDSKRRQVQATSRHTSFDHAVQLELARLAIASLRMVAAAALVTAVPRRTAGEVVLSAVIEPLPMAPFVDHDDDDTVAYEECDDE